MAEDKQSDLNGTPAGAVDVDAEFINEFLNDEYFDNSEQPGEEKRSFEQLDKTVNFILSAANAAIKKRDLPGWDETQTPIISKLGLVCAERNIPGHWLEKSPELMLAGVLGSILLENYLAYREKQPEKEEVQKDD